MYPESAFRIMEKLKRNAESPEKGEGIAALCPRTLKNKFEMFDIDSEYLEL